MSKDRLEISREGYPGPGLYLIDWGGIRFVTDRAGMRQLGKALLEAAGESDQLTLSERYGTFEVK